MDQSPAMADKPETIASIRRAVQSETFTTEDLIRWGADPRRGVQSLCAQAQRMLQKNADEQKRLADMSTIERGLWQRGARWIAGVDEVGAGPLAGPVVAAAVVLPPDCLIVGVDDSKKLSAKRRELLNKEILEHAEAYAVGSCSPEEIDELNIYQAGREAMRRAIKGLPRRPDHVLVDARTIPSIGCPQRAVPGGDRRSHSIAAASIVAKVYRDALMDRIGDEYPDYGFESHRGYGTRAHLQALSKWGPTPWHRRSFAPVRAAFSAGG